MSRLPVVFSVAFLCACSAPAATDRPSIFKAVPSSSQFADTWTFEVDDTNGNDLGYIVLQLTLEPVDAEECGLRGWYRAEVIDNQLRYSIVAELAPAFLINGPWITVDLSASSCNAAYKMLGTMSEEGASGHFNFVHSIGGENIGSFIARPVRSDQGGPANTLSLEN